MYKTFFNSLGDALRAGGISLHRLGTRLQGNYAYVEQLNRHSRIAPFKDVVPFVGQSTFVAPNSAVIGDVSLGKNSSVWYNCVLRGDVNSIIIGDETTIGDRSVIHVANHGPQGEQATVIGNRVYIGPGAIIHGAEIQDGAYIGAGSIVYDGSVMEKNSILEAGSLLTSGKKVKEGEVWGGSPAKFIRNITDKECEKVNKLVDDNVALSEEHDVEQSKSAKQIFLDQVNLNSTRRTRPDYLILSDKYNKNQDK
ncbi:hypothetical protein CYY_009638 [Polysphondylium violaceum]|uniref:Trimeric LpxA-like domain-containing protein n=1 Tax=Polysphondylium violaceum TaxID=133409 RepID=A0A8J4PJU2_9MYCE|nr:hypothetical protein CYY_009638 [Polysphondylium violaceum]